MTDAHPAPAITPDVISGEIGDFVRAHERRRRQMPRAVLVGVVAGLVAVAFRLSIESVERLRAALLAHAHGLGDWGVLLPVAFGALGAGLGVELVRRLAPETAGSGIPHLKAVLHHVRGMAWRRVLAVKFVAGALAVVGMAALFTAIVRAPLTGIVLIVEMTGNYSLMLPLLGACLCAYGVADLLGDRPIYEALLEHTLRRSRDAAGLEGTLLLELTVQPASAFDGRRVGDLGLPSGCLIVNLRRGLGESVPTRDTRLVAGDRITVVVAPEAAAATELLRAGVTAGGERP